MTSKDSRATDRTDESAEWAEGSSEQGGGGLGLPGPLGAVAGMAQSGFSTVQDLLQVPLRQLQEWLAGQDGPLQAVVSQVTEQVARIQQEVIRQLGAMRREQRETLKELQHVAIGAKSSTRSTSGGRAGSASRRTSTPKTSTTREPTTKKPTAKRSTAKRSTPKRSTPKRSTAKRSTAAKKSKAKATARS